MAWGIFEPRSSSAHVPATVPLEESVEDSMAHHDHLKKTSHGGRTIILVPQPSNDPNDPLNWPLWQRDLIFLLYTYCTILTVGGIGPIISPIAYELTVVFGVPFTKVSLLTGYSLLATACFGIIISPIARKFGRRIPLVFSMCCGFAGCLWGGRANTYESLLGARIVQGFCVCMFESLSFVIVGDLYHVHERGVRVAVVTTAIIGLGALPPVASGKIAEVLGWRWIFLILAVFMGVGVLWAAFFGFETAYTREDIYSTDTASQNGLDQLNEKLGLPSATHNEHPEGLVTTETSTGRVIPRKTYWARLNLWSGTYSAVPFWRLTMQPFLVFYHPAVVIWAIFLFSFPVLWLVAFNLLIAQIFVAPPYSLDTAQLGYMSAGAVVGGTLGSLLCAILSDPMIELFARKNGGLYEPEFRLFLIGLALILTIAAYFPFGFMIRDGVSAIAVSAMYGIATAAGQICMAVVGAYIVDAYRQVAVEVFVVTMVIKNFLFFGFSYFINDWIASWGVVKFFCTVGAIQLAFCLTTVPLYMYGKRLRLWWHNSQVNAK